MKYKEIFDLNTKENAFYQRLIRYVRHRNIAAGWGWQGKAVNDKAVTRYPNILAEVDAYTGWLHLPAEFAGVSKEIMAAVLEDNEELSAREMLGLTRFYGCKYSYLSAPTLQLIDPATNKGKARRRLLADRFAHIHAEDVFDAWEIERVLKDMEAGYLVTYAAWRQAYRIIEREATKARKPALRTVRRAAV